MEEEVFEIENIANNEGCFVNLLKYATLFIIGFIAIWIMTLKTFGAIGFEHGKLFSFIISMGLTGYFLHKILNRSDEVYKILFNDKENTVTLVSGNTFDGVDASVKIQYDAQIHRNIQVGAVPWDAVGCRAVGCRRENSRIFS